VPFVRGFVQAGKLKAIAIAAAARSPVVPQVPTLSESGFPNIDPRTWFGLFATGGTPLDVVRRIHGDVAAVLADPEFRERQLIERGYEPGTSASPDEFAQFIQKDLVYKAQLIKNAQDPGRVRSIAPASRLEGSVSAVTALSWPAAQRRSLPAPRHRNARPLPRQSGRCTLHAPSWRRCRGH